MSIESILKQILILNQGSTFYSFSNADGKQWIMPEKNMRTAMCLYQPSGIKGKMIKRWFPIFCHIRILRKIIHASKITCILEKELYDILSKSFNTNKLEFSIFCGTPCAHQKITIQLSLGNHIFGYCKVSGNPKIAVLFQGESQILNYLFKRKIYNIPKYIYCGTLPNELHVFIQDTKKTNYSYTIHKWSTLQEDFLLNLYQCTKQNIRFEKSDYYNTLIKLQQHLNWLPQNLDKNIVQSAIDDIISKFNSQEVIFSAYHADFTPWNMFIEKKHLFVFDWEYARLTYPPMLDKYHFFLQTSIFERHWSSDEIIQYIKSDNGQWIDTQKLQFYLLGIISQFTIREKGNAEGDILHSFNIWFSLLSYLSK
jgi:hypothetical protein